MIDGVKVIDMDIPLNRSYFLVHSDDRGIGLEKYKENARKYNRICTSILDNNHTKTFIKGVIFGYCNIASPIYSAIPFDGQTNQRNHDSGRPQYRSVLSDVDRFMHRTTRKYNEITYNTNNELLMPSYILVVDREPNEIELNTAKDFKIPILIYHPKVQNYEYEEGYTVGELFDYEKRTFDFIPNSNEIHLENTI